MKIKKTLISILTGFCISLMIASLFTACNENSTTNNSTENKKTESLGLEYTLNYGSGYGHALLLTARQRVHIPVLIVGHAHHLQHLPHAFVDLGLRHLLEFQTESDVVIHIQMREQGITLEDGVDRPFVRRHIRDVRSVYEYFSGVRGAETCYHAQERGLSAARRAEESQELALLYRYAHIVQDTLVPEAFGYILYFDYVFHGSLFLESVVYAFGCVGEIEIPCEADIYVVSLCQM